MTLQPPLPIQACAQEPQVSLHVLKLIYIMLIYVLARAPSRGHSSSRVTVPTVTLARKVGPGLQDLQTRARRILAERNAEKAEENTWIGRMVAAESIRELDGLIRSRAA